MMHRKRWIIVLIGTLLVPHASLLATQESVNSQSSTPAGSPSTNSTSADARPTDPKAHTTAHRHANEILIHGTVFDAHAMAIPGVEIKIRRTGEKKTHWSSYSNRRGEFAIRVPQGAEYEVVAEKKGIRKQAQTVDGKNGGADGNLVFHLEPGSGGK